MQSEMGDDTMVLLLHNVNVSINRFHLSLMDRIFAILSIRLCTNTIGHANARALYALNISERSTLCVCVRVL